MRLVLLPFHFARSKCSRAVRWASARAARRPFWAAVGLVGFAEAMCELIDLGTELGTPACRCAVAVTLLVILAIRWRRRRGHPPTEIVEAVVREWGDASQAGIAGRYRTNLLKLENQLLAEIHRARSLASAVNVLVRRLSLDLDDGFVAFLSSEGRDAPEVANRRGLTQESAQSLTLDQELRARLEAEDSVVLEGRAFRSSSLFRGLAHADRKRLKGGVRIVRLGPPARTFGWLVTTALFKAPEPIAQQLDMLEYLGNVIGQRWPQPVTKSVDVDHFRPRPARPPEPLIDQVRQVLTEARSASVERVSVYLRTPTGGLSTVPVASVGASGPPGVESTWQRHEGLVAARAVSSSEAVVLGEPELAALSIRTLMVGAIGCRILLRGQTVGMLCLSARGRLENAGPLVRATETAAAAISRLLEFQLVARAVPAALTRLPDREEARPGRAAEGSEIAKGRQPSELDRVFAVGRSDPNASNVPFEQKVAAPDAAKSAPQEEPLELLATVTHELRAPMVGILGMTDLVLESELTEQQREYLSAVRTSSENLLQLVNDLLVQSKLSAHKVEFEAIAFSLRDLLNSVALPFELAARKKGVEFSIHIGHVVSDQRIGDPLRVRQVLNNLLSNAVKFVERGEVSVTVASLDPTRLEFAVRDTGIGIPAEKQSRLFERYSQADPSTARRFGGTGLGLSITQQLIDGMGGEIGVESAEGAGTTFRVVLPLPEATSTAQATSERAREENPEATSAQSAARPLRVLLVEDHEINVAVGIARLEQAGHLVKSARSSAEALEAIRRQSFDLVLMDLQLPDADGFETTLRLREHERPRRTPVFALTSAIGEGDRVRAAEAGIDAVLTKPLDVAEIESRVGDAIDLAKIPPVSMAVPAEEPLSELAKELLPLFLESARGTTKEMTEAIRDADFGRIARHAHSLCGAASTLGISSVRDAALRIEQAARSASLVELDSPWRQLQAALSHLRESLRDLRENSAPQSPIASLPPPSPA